jgi:prophage regulatory protein
LCYYHRRPGHNLSSRELPNGSSAMKLLSKRQVREIVLYSPAHIARLEKAGLFPKRVRLGQGRVGWIDSEVDGWVNARIAERDQRTGS